MTIESFGCTARWSSAGYGLQAGASLAGMTGVAAAFVNLTVLAERAARVGQSFGRGRNQDGGSESRS